MSNDVLVAFASKHGATAEIADGIGDALRMAGIGVDVTSVESVGELAPYRAVVLGSAVYVGKWRKEAVAFLEDNEAALAERAVWLFSSGPTGEGDAAELLEGWRLPDNVQEIADRVAPRDVVVLHGDVDPDKLNVVQKMMIKMVKAPIGDYRDWDAINAWADSIAATLNDEAAETGS